MRQLLSAFKSQAPCQGAGDKLVKDTSLIALGSVPRLVFSITFFLLPSVSLHHWKSAGMEEARMTWKVRAQKSPGSAELS